MLTTNKKPIKKPIIKRNKFANLTQKDWKESNIVTSKNRGVSGLTYKEIYGDFSKWPFYKVYFV